MRFCKVRASYTMDMGYIRFQHEVSDSRLSSPTTHSARALEQVPSIVCKARRAGLPLALER